ncbi:hypothetical protein [Streptomyces sp. MA15]|uniref:hypothetical protein n=1 Tax=Streptomyces sp. MA15 TaxID=3055061 RepID=UPI00339D89C5
MEGLFTAGLVVAVLVARAEQALILVAGAPFGRVRATVDPLTAPGGPRRFRPRHLSDQCERVHERSQDFRCVLRHSPFRPGPFAARRPRAVLGAPQRGAGRRPRVADPGDTLQANPANREIPDVVTPGAHGDGRP